MAEEAYSEMTGGKTLVSTLGFPTGNELSDSPPQEMAPALERERIVEGVEDDIASLMKVWKTPPTHLTLFVADPWKYSAEGRIRGLLKKDGKVEIGLLMREAKEAPELAAHMKDLPRYAGDTKGKGLDGLPPLLTQQDELDVLREAASYLARRFDLRSVDIWTETEGATHDPANRRSRARPGKPALAIE
jgi:hypothetical protein